MKKEEKGKAIIHLKEVLEHIYGNKKNLDPSKRKIVFTTFEGSLAHNNLLKLFQEEVIRQSEELELDKGIWEQYRNEPPLTKEEVDTWVKKQMRK